MNPHYLTRQEVLDRMIGETDRAEYCDGHFVVDRDREHENVVFAAGFSGHGFKFMSALGAILCELAIDGQTPSPIDFLRLDRFPERTSAGAS